MLAGIVSGVGIVLQGLRFSYAGCGSVCDGAWFARGLSASNRFLFTTVLCLGEAFAGEVFSVSTQWGFKALQALPRELAPIVVNAFWQSTNTEDGPVKRWDPTCVEPGSTWSALMELAGIPKVHTGNVVACIVDAVHDLAPNIWLPRTLPRIRMVTKGKDSRFYHEIILNCSLSMLFFTWCGMPCVRCSCRY